MRYIVGLLAAIGFIILIIVLIAKALGGGGPAPKLLDLNSFADSDTVMQLTIDGPINADQVHQSVQITIGQTNNQIDVLQGYQGHVTKSKTYDNNSASYSEFLHALTLLGYNQGNTDPNLKSQSGYCAAGSRYSFDVIQDNSTIQHYWSTSCSQGNYKGQTSATLDLFEAQIPDYDTLTNQLNI